ncbi:MAG: helix-turn-helix transcriptional regulator [Candidatus Thioglobus sp.]|nr:helix-turn-helix transcriptional regulator [Candidatus Thioglobus sp.]MBT6360075.1 helix-turn-helix transcriptional regulator [Candidatus Thioglobus sp.]
MEKALYSSNVNTPCNWLKEQRINSDLTMKELGLLLNVHHSIVGKIELGERRLDVIEWIQYCEALNADPFECLETLVKK